MPPHWTGSQKLSIFHLPISDEASNSVEAVPMQYPVHLSRLPTCHSPEVPGRGLGSSRTSQEMPESVRTTYTPLSRIHAGTKTKPAKRQPLPPARCLAVCSNSSLRLLEYCRVHVRASSTRTGNSLNKAQKRPG